MLILVMWILLGASPVLAMEHYTQSLQDQNGSSISGASVSVYEAGTKTLATIYSDNGTTTKANPFKTGVDGIYDFYAASGVYDIVFVSPRSIISDEKTRRIALFDIHDGAFPPVTAFAASPSLWSTVIYLSDTAVGACNPAGGGTSVSVCMWNGLDWVAVIGGGGSGSTLDQAFDGGTTIDGATTANPMVVGNGTQGVKIGGDPTIGGFVQGFPPGDSPWNCWAGFNCVMMDRNTGNPILTINPLAASKNAMYQFGAAFKPLATIHVPLNPRGAASGAYESIVSNQPNDYYLTVTDANTDAVDFTVFVTKKMAGATTATFRLVGVSKNASPSGNIDLDCALSTFTPGTDTYTSHVTTGEVTALLTPATQNRPVAVTTSAHTINGGPLVEGDIIKGSCEVDASATTSAQMSDFRLEGVVAITLDVNSLSE